MIKESWKEEEHPIWGKGGKETEALKNLEYLQDFPQKIWRKGKYSIIPPSKITFDRWELFDGEYIKRFDTLEAAQEHVHNLTL